MHSVIDTFAAMVIEETAQIESKGCSKCGDTGIHACIGSKPEPWTEEDRRRFWEVLEQIREGVRK